MKYCGFLFLMITFFLAQAQEMVEVHFPNEEHDFGEIPEDGGVVSFLFTFVNTGASAITLKNATPSCGCTVPTWAQGAVQPSDTGQVEISFDPTNRPGGFRKFVSLKFEESDSAFKLYVKGRVVPGSRPIGDTYDVAIGQLSLKYRTLNMGNIYSHEVTTKSFDIYNNGDTTLVFRDSIEHPAHLAVKIIPTEIPAKEHGKIEISFTPEGYEMLGFHRDVIRLMTYEPTDSIKELYVSAGIIPYFPSVAVEDTAVVPKLTFESKKHDFKKIDNSRVLTHDFLFENTGQEPLEILKVSSNCNCIEVNAISIPMDTVSSGKLSIRFDPAGRKGSQTSFVTVFSNDPVNPVQTLTIKANVETEN